MEKKNRTTEKYEKGIVKIPKALNLNTASSEAVWYYFQLFKYFAE